MNCLRITEINSVLPFFPSDLIGAFCSRYLNDASAPVNILGWNQNFRAIFMQIKEAPYGAAFLRCQ
jgi:hypothetical protein